MQWLLSLFVGIGLSATCGFRIFLPMLGMSIACKCGNLEFAPGFGWMGSWLVIFALSIATILEIAAYYIPYVDNLLDTFALPAAAIAGTLITGSMIGGDVGPFFRWTLAIIAGGGAATAVQGGTTLVRGGSTATTGGAANPLVATLELIASIIGTIISIVLPIIAVLILMSFILIVYWLFIREKRPKNKYGSLHSKRA